MDDCGDRRIGGQFIVGTGIPISLGVGDKKINGSMLAEGPVLIGDPVKEFLVPEATLMVAPLTNSDPDIISKPNYSLFVKTFARIKSFLKIDKQLVAELIKAKIIYTEVLMAKTKNFIIDHPSEKGKKLIYACLEGPENAVYIRGRVTNKKSIIFPHYWKDLIDWTTITVNLTPIGAHQNVIIKRFDDTQVYLQSNGGMPIDCFYHIYATRKDVPRLITEVDA